MTWTLHPGMTLDTGRVPLDDTLRQTRTATEILKRLDHQPGVVLADEVGMGKTYVALAVAASVLESTKRRRPVVVMVPSSVAHKWHSEWEVFQQRCLPAGHGLRIPDEPVRTASEFLKLLDDDAESRRHVIVLTHGALNRSLQDPLIRLAVIRRALLHRRDADGQRQVVARVAAALLNERKLTEPLALDLLRAPVAQWRQLWNLAVPRAPLDDDPVPFKLEEALSRVDLASVREALADLPVRRTATFDQRLSTARRSFNPILREVWTKSLRALDVRLPLVILDEAHHVRNPNQLARLFSHQDPDDEQAHVQLGGMFDRMLFLTATPFQLGHSELLEVLGRFDGIRWQTARDRGTFATQLEDLRRTLDRAQGSAMRLGDAWGGIDPLDHELVANLTYDTPRAGLPDRVVTALGAADDLKVLMSTARRELSPWVIRHVKADKEHRRQTEVDGLPVEGSATLPFLLAARAQAIAGLEGPSGSGSTNSYFAYGLASSFEAYAETRLNRSSGIDTAGDHGDVEAPKPISDRTRWYLDRISRSLPSDAADGWATHPKVAAVVSRVLDLWRAGEKAVVFCFYVETGKALRTHISRAIRRDVLERAAASLQLVDATDDEVLDQVARSVTDCSARTPARIA